MAWPLRLRGYVEGYARRTGIEVNLDLPQEEIHAALAREAETALFRIVQE